MKFRELLAKKFQMFAQNEILMKAYMEEKKKLDFHIRRDNFKMTATQNMIN
jgi:hypothetical protein